MLFQTFLIGFVAHLCIFTSVEGFKKVESSGIVQPNVNFVSNTDTRGFKGTGIKRKPKPSRLGQAQRRQEEHAGPGLNITSVSPIELSLGGLTGLQGLPPLSLIQLVKLLVAVTPFIIPLIFVPLLIFTIGIFMIPIQKPNIFVGDEFARSLTQVASGIINHEECFDRLVCEIGNRFFEKSGNAKNKESSVEYRNIIGRIMAYFNHPVLQRVSKSITIPKTICGLKQCRLMSFF